MSLRRFGTYAALSVLSLACGSSGSSNNGSTVAGGGGTKATGAGGGSAGTVAAGGTTAAGGAAGAGAGGAAGLCQACVTEMDCGGQKCAQLAGDNYCAAPCNAGQCGAGTMCATVADYQGQQVDVCVPVTSCGGGLGGMGAGGGTPGAGGGTTGETCGSLDGPDVASCCTCKSNCAANNCYNGWWCNRDTCKCQPAPDPAMCGTGTGGSGAGGSGAGGTGAAGSGQAGGPPAGTVGPTGGTLDNLQFAIVGDTRPAQYNDTAGYPTAVITQIWKDVESEGVPFTIMTGDYQFAVGAETAKQLDLYVAARQNYSKVAFPAMGNHECTGATDSNCGAGNKDGATPNFTNFLAKLLGPIGQKQPYYTINVNAKDNSWTSKFVFVAANAWDSYQSTWLEGEMAKPTTYTFVVRHESSQANTAPGVTPSDAIIMAHPWTMLLVGHTHTFEYFSSEKQVVTGNGGAPLAGSAPYGYVVVTRRISDGALMFQAKEYTAKKVFKSFNVNAAGVPVN